LGGAHYPGQTATIDAADSICPTGVRPRYTRHGLEFEDFGRFGLRNYTWLTESDTGK
jgi:hypothetical protein